MCVCLFRLANLASAVFSSGAPGRQSRVLSISCLGRVCIERFGFGVVVVVVDGGGN